MSKATSDWPPELDALIAAPSHHRLAYEDERVRVLETKVPPGETVPVHTHRWPATLYFLGWSDFVRRNDMGEVMLDTLAANVRIEPGTAQWSQPLPPHSLQNVGDNVLHVIATEFKAL